MSEFVTRWANWGGSAVGTGHQSASETSKRASAGFAGAQVGHSEQSSSPPSEKKPGSGPGKGSVARVAQEFVPQWSSWDGGGGLPASQRSGETGYLDTSKTSKRAVAASAGTQEGPSEHSPDLSYSPEYDLGPTESGRQKSGGARIQGMTLAEFATAGLVVEVNSEVLAGRIFFVSDNVPDSRLAGVRRPVYRAHELRRLAILRPEPRTLRSLHEVKTIFDGVITDVTPEDPEA